MTKIEINFYRINTKSYLSKLTEDRVLSIRAKKKKTKKTNSIRLQEVYNCSLSTKFVALAKHKSFLFSLMGIFHQRSGEDWGICHC